jgi:hypothetical protein
MPKHALNQNMSSAQSELLEPTFCDIIGKLPMKTLKTACSHLQPTTLDILLYIYFYDPDSKQARSKNAPGLLDSLDWWYGEIQKPISSVKPKVRGSP